MEMRIGATAVTTGVGDKMIALILNIDPLEPGYLLRCFQQVPPQLPILNCHSID